MEIAPILFLLLLIWLGIERIVNIFTIEPIDLYESIKTNSWVLKPRGEFDTFYLAIVQVSDHTVKAPYIHITDIDRKVKDFGKDGFAVLHDIGIASIEELIVHSTSTEKKYSHVPVFIFKTENRRELIAKLDTLMRKFKSVGSAEYRKVYLVRDDDCDYLGLEGYIEDEVIIKSIEEFAHHGIAELVYYEAGKVLNGRIVSP